MSTPTTTPTTAPSRPRRVRLAGSRWRLLVHRWVGPGRPDGCRYDYAYELASRPPRCEPDSEHGEHHTFAGTEFDELVVSSWLHIEQYGPGRWWLDIGGVRVHVTADRDGRPTHVMVHGPGEYDEARPGVRYELAWGAM